MKSFPTEKVISYSYIVFYYIFFLILRMKFVNPKAVDSQSIVNSLTKSYHFLIIKIFFNDKKIKSVVMFSQILIMFEKKHYT
ncbi:hypothetical protein EMQU_0844 [Enterococcus mundtii QU 25]|nr:hypothetical protein EMQU_0844 [Enterococcus mundtii QU 25]